MRIDLVLSLDAYAYTLAAFHDIDCEVIDSGVA